MFVTGAVAHLTVLIVLLDPVTFVTGSEVRGFLGQSITLPCSYSVRKNGEAEVCWGRGRCSMFSCSDTLITTNGKTVTSTKSSKYHLDGKVEEGDVSLTVDHLRVEDNGRYCCRVEIPGLFNDVKVNYNLLVLEAISTLLPLLTGVSLTTDRGNHVTSNATEGITGNLNSTFTISPDETSSLSQTTHLNVSNVPPQVWVGIGLAILICLTGIAIFIFSKKLKKFTKDNSANSIFGMHTRQTVEENVYDAE